MSDQFTFTVTNNTDQTITDIWASLDPDADEWPSFGLPDDGVPPGETITIAWAEHTNDTPCEWYVQFGFEDESESEAAIFNFCEEPNLVVG